MKTVRSLLHGIGAHQLATVMKRTGPADASPFTRLAGVLRPVARSVSATTVRVAAAVPGVTPGLQLLWELRRYAGLEPAPLAWTGA
jgi:hypothetical protein